MKKRILSCLMALALCLTLLPTAALAEETEGTVQTPPAVKEAADPANGEAKQEKQSAAPEQENQSAEQEEQQENSASKQDEAVAAMQAMIDALPDAKALDGMDDEALEAVTAQLAAIEDAMEDMTDEQLDKLEAARYEAAVSALAQLGGGDAPAIMAAGGRVAEYHLWVGGSRVTSENKDNIPIQGGKASYDPDTKTLTLNNATINQTVDNGSYGTRSAIFCSDYSNADLQKIVLVGSNSVYASNTSYAKYQIICVVDDLTITGGGSLTVSAPYSTTYTGNDTRWSEGIYVFGDLVIDHTTVSVSGGNASASNSLNSAIYFGGSTRLILNGTKVTSCTKKAGKTDTSGFKYSELNDYRVLKYGLKAARRAPQFSKR